MKARGVASEASNINQASAIVILAFSRQVKRKGTLSLLHHLDEHQLRLGDHSERAGAGRDREPTRSSETLAQPSSPQSDLVSAAIWLLKLAFSVATTLSERRDKQFLSAKSCKLSNDPVETLFRVKSSSSHWDLRC